jgi:DNA primase catalytic subunit
MGGDYQKIHISTLLKYYKRPEIQEALVSTAGRKEIAVSYGGTGYGKRPDALNYPRDVLEMVKQGATSFHCSEELWRNPLHIVTGMKPEELNELRLGWDLILDIDCPELEYSKIAADLLVQALRHHGVQHVSVKFSGNHGFHIGVPFEAFPETVNGKPIKDQFPDGPRKIAAYLQQMIKAPLAEKLLQKDAPAKIAEKIKKTSAELTKNGQFEPFNVLSIDTILIATRHLYRMPYSLNEKSGLVSVVIKPEEILSFDKKEASPEKVVPKMTYLDRNDIIPGEAKKLIVQAFDFKSSTETPQEIKELVEKKREFEPITDAIPEQYFPPCIQLISQGLKDGKKRALFVLINFLSSCGWPYDRIENYLVEWNKKNPEPLREVNIQGQLRYHKMMKKRALPPNCDNKAYMVDLGVCKPDGFCSKIKNPANYAIAKQRMMARMAEKGKKTAKQEPL